jgi:hypothetical protein
LRRYWPDADNKMGIYEPGIFQERIWEDPQARRTRLNNPNMTSHIYIRIAQIVTFPINDRNLIV